MTNIEKPDEFDLEKIRKRVSEIRARSPDEKVEAEEPVKLNPFARQIAEQFREGNYTPSIIIGQFMLFEFISLLALGLLLLYLRFGSPTHEPLIQIPIVLFVAAANILSLQLFDTYQIPMLRAPMRHMRRIALGWTLPFVAIPLIAIALKSLPTFPPRLVMSWCLIGLAFLFTERLLFAWGIRRWARNGIMERRAVIVGGGQPAKDLIRALEDQVDNDIRICGIFDDRGERRSPVMVAGYPKLGTVAELVEFARVTRIDMLIIALPISAEDRILQLLKKVWVLPVDIRLAAHANKLRFRPRTYSHVGTVPMLDIFNKPIPDWDSVAKRAFDVFFSLLALLLLWPVMVGAAIAIKLNSKGPVFFMQKRHGFNNEIINVLKFRSMYTDMSDPTARNAVTKGDPRVTSVGRFIRKSSIDELPQLFNVLMGSLSLVGPRPHAVAASSHDRAYGDVVEGYFARHRVKPGVTGWAQINGWRGEIDNDDKIKFRTAYDLYYIENWSLWFDLKILFLTPIRLLNTENAY